MSKLHIVFKLSAELHLIWVKGIFERIPLSKYDLVNVAPKSSEMGINLKQIKTLISDELTNYGLDGMDKMFPNMTIIGSGFNLSDYKYHLWVESKDGIIQSQDLSNTLARIKSDTKWYLQWVIDYPFSLDVDQLKSLGLGYIDLIPEVESIYVVQENLVMLDQLPNPI